MKRKEVVLGPYTVGAVFFFACVGVFDITFALLKFAGVL